jgi:hypothetical protein
VVWGKYILLSWLLFSGKWEGKKFEKEYTKIFLEFNS